MAKSWFAEIADLRAKYPLLVVVRDNSGENTPKELNDFLAENGVKNYFSTPYEQWQNGLAESLVVWLCNHAGKDRNGRIGTRGRILVQRNSEWCELQEMTYKERLRTTPFEKTYGVKKNVSKFRPFGCRAYMHLNKDRSENLKAKAVEAINLGFTLN